jgi:hypothetical protein
MAATRRFETTNLRRPGASRPAKLNLHFAAPMRLIGTVIAQGDARPDKGIGDDDHAQPAEARLDVASGEATPPRRSRSRDSKVGGLAFGT